MNVFDVLLITIKSIILVLGGSVTVIAFRAYRRTAAEPLKILGVGFGVITVGALITGVANQFYSLPLDIGVLVNSTFVAAGLAIILYSLYIQE
ncbi:MAG: hypothetical protein ABEH90_00040 [Halolamina sp.]